MSHFSINSNIAAAKTLPTDFYKSETVFEQCKEQLFASTWQFVGNTDLVKEIGDVFPFTLLEDYLNEPLLLSKDNDGKINLLSNVCTHRGNIIANAPCNLANLRCRYHGRRFDLNGKFISMPEFKEVENFPCADDDLTQLNLFKWRKWLFTTLNKKLNADVLLNDMMQRVNWMPLDDFVFRPDLSKEFTVNAHWALYCENYLEGFHIPFVHAGLNAIIEYHDYATELFYPYSSLQIGIGKNPEDCFKLPEDSPDFGKNIAAYYFWIFPNMMFNFYPWGLSVNIVKPISIAKSKISYLTYIWDESKFGTGAGAALDKVEMEDEEIVQNVQKGIQSRFYKQGRYSATREQGTHHFHRIIADFLK